eukprot:GFUD01073327.1.p1 GENE.GFUD01073327.1~~GFUD01073327.1.p1  ORF type:complete len:153 (+),score=10.03 GFUD01073327.1:651-1109(+)
MKKEKKKMKNIVLGIFLTLFGLHNPKKHHISWFLATKFAITRYFPTKLPFTIHFCNIHNIRKPKKGGKLQAKLKQVVKNRSFKNVCCHTKTLKITKLNDFVSLFDKVTTPQNFIDMRLPRELEPSVKEQGGLKATKSTLVSRLVCAILTQWI